LTDSDDELKALHPAARRKLTKKVENATKKEESRKNAQSKVNARKSFDPTVGPAAKLKIKNLDLGVTVDDLAELFSDFGPLKGTYINKDRSGKSLGTANVYFEKKSSALKAMKKYNGVTLDQKPMQIHIPVPEYQPNNSKIYGKKNSPKMNLDNGKSKSKEGGQNTTRNNGQIKPVIDSRGDLKAKLKVSNLDPSVKAADMTELFSEFGQLKWTKLNKDKSGQSLGSAYIVFDKKDDAVRAMKKYNGVKLDRKPMTVTLLTEFIKPNLNGSKMGNKNSPGRNFENGRSNLQEKCMALFEAKNEKISKLPDLDDFLESKENFQASTMVKVAKTLGKKTEKSFSFPVCVPKKNMTEKSFSFPVCVPKKIRKQDGSFLNDLLENKENIKKEIAKIDAEQKTLGKKGKKKESKPKPTYDDLDKEMDDYMKARPNCR